MPICTNPIARNAQPIPTLQIKCQSVISSSTPNPNPHTEENIPRNQLPRHTRKDQPPRRRPARRNTDSQRPSLVKIRAQHRHRRTKQQSIANAHADPLRQEHLPVGLADGRGEDAQDLEDGPRQEDGAEVARVRQPAGDGADEEEQEDLHGADPGDGGGRGGEGGDVVGLEDAEGVDEAPGPGVSAGGLCC